LSAYKRLASLKSGHVWGGGSYQKTENASVQELALGRMIDSQLPFSLGQESVEWTRALNDFFDHVRVQGSEESENRLNLLQQVSAHLQKWGRFDLCVEEYAKICLKEDS
jgi:hypothetical protein